MKLLVCFSWIFGTGLLLFCQFRVLAQPKTDTLVLCRPIADTVDLRPFGRFWLDSSSRVSFPEIEKIWPATHSLSYETPVPSPRLENGRFAVWHHFVVKNEGSDSARLVLYFENQALDSVQTWVKTADGHVEYQLRGIWTQPNLDDWRHRFVIHLGRTALVLPPGQTTEIWVRLRYFYGFNQFFRPQFLEMMASVNHRTHFYFIMFMVLNTILCAFLLGNLLYSILRIWKTRGSLAHIFFMLTTLFSLIYQWITVERVEASVRFLPVDFANNYWPHTPLAMGTWIFYLLFIQHLLETRRTNLRLHRVINLLIGLFAGWVLWSRLFIWYFDKYDAYRWTYYFRLILYPFGMVMLVLLARSFNRQSRYVLAGTIFMLFGGLIGSVLSLAGFKNLFGLFDSEEVFSKLGLLLALIFLWIGLGEQETEMLHEKAEAQQNLIAQLKENAVLKEKTRQNLEARLAFLSQQFKPHFIFNTLASIRNFIGKGKNDEAEDYLVDFASFLRQTLDASEKEKISLAEELEIAENYLKMEQLRFRDRFDFEIKTGGHELRFNEVPPLILQPFLENALKHGILPKEEKGILLIEISENNGHFVVAVDDDGIGRTEAKPARIGVEKTSHGLRISRQRIESFNELFGQNLRLEIIDKLASDGSAAGTRVELHF